MKQEIRQNGIAILTSDDNCSIPVIFNNLTGKNHKTDEEYQIYIETTAIPMMGFSYGEIERIEKGKIMETGRIK